MRRAHKQIGTPKENACAFCRLHHAHLSAKQMRNRECLKKNCWHLSPFPNHPYWVQREREKELKKERRDARRAVQTVPTSDTGA